MHVLYPKICPPIFSTLSHHKTLRAQDPARVSSAQDFSLHYWPKLGFVFAQSCFDLKCLRWLSCFILDSRVYPYQVSSLDSNLCPINWTVDLEISCIGEKVNCGQFTVKSHNFLIHINIINSYEPFNQVWTTTPQKIWSNLQKGKMVKIRVFIGKGQFLIFGLANGQLV